MKNLEEMIAVMEASKTKEIECSSLLSTAPCWTICKEPKWAWSDFDYRVKPQVPRRVWLAHDQSGHAIWILHMADSTLSNAAEYVELTPEVKSKLGLT